MIFRKQFLFKLFLPRKVFLLKKLITKSFVINFCIILFSLNAFADEIIATIGEKGIITKNELEQNIKIELLMQSPKDINNQNVINSIRYSVLNDLINNKIFLAHAEKIKLSISNEQVLQEINIATGLFPRFKGNYKKNLKLNGIEYEYFLDKIRGQIITQNIVVGMINPEDNLIKDEEVDQRIKLLKLEATNQNKDKVRYMILVQKFNDNFAYILSKLKKMYYVEVL